MKILIVGASGMIGSEVLIQCLAHPRISKVVAFVRQELSAQVSGHPKLESVLIKDFSAWPEDVLQAHKDAAAMIWNMGSYNGSVAVDLEYPIAFQESMARVLESKDIKSRFRYVILGGKFVRQNQEQKLWFLDKPRKIKGLLETRALSFAEKHANMWEAFIVKPGGVVPKKVMGSGVLGMFTAMGAVMGENWSIRIDELGAFMTYLAIDGKGEDSITENARIVRKGRELLKSQNGGSES
ncbi:hypothetical protein BKA56DRAFT_496937 [Ilyonectria sp. MPI-CAGE-AT-0026]|nr:hypothetical protein BKA56DRAFT_496937 [Ilyonectria sp. MPI-CAGE-AT-0026]